MNYLYKLEIKKMLSKKLIFVWIGLIIFNLDTRLNENLSSQQFIAESLSNQYYIIYFMIPMFLLIIISNLNDDNKYVLIRSKTYWNYFKSKINICCIFSIIFVLSQFLIIAAMSIGLKNNNSFKSIDFIRYETLNFYSEKFQTLIEPIFYIVIFMILGLFMISLLLHTIHNFFNKQTVIKIIMSIYLLSILSIKTISFKFISFLFINTYIIFHHSFIFGYGMEITLIIEILLILLLCKINKDYWNKDFNLKMNIFTNSNHIRKVSNKSGIIKYYSKSLFNKYNIGSLIFVLLVMCIWKLVSSNDNTSINRYLLNIFAGTYIGEKNPFIILEMLVFNLTPIYLLSVFIERECNERTIFFNIRLKKSLVWFKSIIKISFKFILIYTILNILIPIFISRFLGLSVEVGFYKLTILIFIIKLLNIIFEFLTLFLIYNFTKNITISFFSLIIFNLISIIPFKFIYYVPFGISSLYRYQFILSNYGINYGLHLRHVVLELFILNTILLIYLSSKHKKLIIH